jgi:transcriptional regulator with XRE-family HTH domain
MSQKDANPIDVHVGGRVRLRRTLIGMTQDELARALGLTFQQIQKYEKGANKISASRLYRLSELLKVSVQFFYDAMPDDMAANFQAAIGFSEPEIDTPYVNPLATAEGVQLHQYFSKIKDLALRRRVVELVRAIAEQHGPLGPGDSDGDSDPD